MTALLVHHQLQPVSCTVAAGSKPTCCLLKASALLTTSWCPALQIINGDQAVLDAVQTTISSGVLQLTTSGTGFQTSQPIQLGVNVPAAALTSVTLTGSAGVLVSDGFNVPALTLQNQGAGTLHVQGLTAQTLTLSTSG